MNKILIKDLIKGLNYCNKFSTNWSTGSLTKELSVGRTAESGQLWSMCLMSRRFAGHSKWANIKHTKLSKDAEKSKLINKLLNKLRYSLRSAGGADPKINRDFGDVMEMCRRANISSTTTDKCIKRALEKRAIPMKLEIMGPNGCLFVVDAESDTKSSLRNSVKAVLKKYKSFAFVDDGRATRAFEEKGVVRVKDKSGQTIDLGKAEEIAIEADAEEVQLSPEDELTLLFITGVQNCHKTRKFIEENTDFEVIESGIELIPYNKVDLPEQTLQEVVTAIEELEDLEEINKVYNNIV